MRFRIFIFLLISFSLSYTFTSASKLAEVKVVDKDYLMLHFLDGEVIYSESPTSSCLYLSLCNDGTNDRVESYNPALNTSQAVLNTNFRISSPDDPAYGTAGVSAYACHRKTKVNGMKEITWNTHDYTLEHFIYLRLPFSMVQGRTYTVQINASVAGSELSETLTFDIFESNTEAIHVNLNGYITESVKKSADLYLWMGDGGARDYSGFAGNKAYLYNVDSKTSQEIGEVQFWRSNGMDNWNFNLTRCDVHIVDFTEVTMEGKYRIAIEGVGCSQDFEIKPDVFFEPFKIATLGYFYMRIGQEPLSDPTRPVPRQPFWIPDVSPANCKIYITTLDPYDAEWSSSGDIWDNRNGAELIWEGQKRGNLENKKALKGHSDAADWDRHLAHIKNIYDILLPFLLTDGALSDDNLGIAESGNGVPDILDEMLNEIDFFLNLRYGRGYSHGLTCPNNGILYQADNTGLAAWASAANCAMISNCLQLSGNFSLSNVYRDSAVVAYNYASNLSTAEQQLDITVNAFNTSGRDLKMMAAAFLYNVTGDTKYEDVVNDLSVVNSNSTTLANSNFNQIYATAGYLITKQPVNYPTLYNQMRSSMINRANVTEAGHTLTSPTRRGVDQDATWWQTAQDMRRTMVAHYLNGDQALLDAMTLEADYGLGRNPLNIIQMTTASTSLASKRSVEQAYTSGANDVIPGMHPGHTPYMNIQNWGNSCPLGCPSMMTSRGYPAWSNWPHAEGYFNIRYVYAANEFTPRQTMSGKYGLYAYLYGIHKGLTGNPTLNVSKSEITLGPANGSSDDFFIASNVNWSVSAGGATWLTLNPSNGSGSRLITVSATQNTASTQRTATITASSAGLPNRTITVTQLGNNANISVSPESITIGVSSGSQNTFTITANVEWSIDESADWLTISNDEGTGNATITVTAGSTNQSTNERVATLLIQSPGFEDLEVLVTQEASAPNLEISTTTMDIPGVGGSDQFTITSNTNWEITGMPFWLTVQPASGSGNQTISVVGGWNSGSDRSATLSISSPDLPSGTKTLVVSQEESGVVLDTKVIYNDSETLITGSWISKGSLSEVNDGQAIEGDRHYRYDASVSESWDNFGLNMNNWSGPGHDFRGYESIQFACRYTGSANVSIILRDISTATASVTIDGINSSYKVFTIPLSDFTGISLAEIMELRIAFGGVQSESGVFNIDNILLIAESTTPDFSVSPSSITIEKPANSNGTFSITASDAWTVSTTTSWLSLNPTSGSGNETITVTATSENMSADDRYGSVAVQSNGNSRTVSVTQWGAINTGVKPENLSDIRIFPNPANSQLHIESPKIVQITMTDLGGSVLLRKSDVSNTTLDISSLSNGLYLLRIESNEGVSYRKFIKNN